MGLFIAIGLFASLGTILPRETTEVFASPDETAVALFARGWSPTEGFRLPTGVPEVIQEIPGLRPRSTVQQGAWIVPVGFLGMPLLVMPFEKVWQGSAAFLTVLLVISSTWPLWQLAYRTMGSRRAALTAVILFLAFPTVLLYANRGLFPNLPIVALGLWSVWLLGQKEVWRVAMGGVLLGLALAIRPVEGIWLIPWAVWAFIHPRTWKGIVKERATAIAALAALVFPALAYLSSIQTYQSATPTIGYWLRDTVDFIAPAPADPTSSFIDIQPDRVLPFGIHPRTMQANIRAFWLNMLWPWVLLASAGFVQLWWQRRITWRSPLLWLAVWTSAVLHLFYGQALYLDNIRGVPAVGNSFLRYMLPLTPLIAFAGAAWVHAVGKKTWQRAAASVLIGGVALYGVWLGLAQDEEGVLATQKELRRYTEIRAAARAHLEPGSIVISERSDKIFAGVPSIVSVSPLPGNGVMGHALNQGVTVALFHRALTQEQQERIGLRFTELFAHDNERLYRVEFPE